MKAPRLEPLGSGFSLFSPEGALAVSLGALAIMAVVGGVFYAVRHSRMRANQARFESKIFQAVQEMKDRTQMLGKPGPWSPRQTA